MQQRLLQITTAHHPPGGGPDVFTPRRDGAVVLSLDRAILAVIARIGAAERPARRGRMPEMMIPWAIDQSIPAIAFPLRRRMSSSGPPPTADVTWLIIQMDPNVLSKEIFPELAQKFFGSSSGMDYYVTVKALGNDGEQVFYSSGPGSGEEKNLPVDATLNLFGPPFGHGGPPDGGVEFFSSPTRPMRAITDRKRTSSTWPPWSGCPDSIHFITLRARPSGNSRPSIRVDQWKQQWVHCVGGT